MRMRVIKATHFIGLVIGLAWALEVRRGCVWFELVEGSEGLVRVVVEERLSHGAVIGHTVLRVRVVHVAWVLENTGRSSARGFLVCGENVPHVWMVPHEVEQELAVAVHLDGSLER